MDQPDLGATVTGYPPLVDGLAATPVHDHILEQWTTTGVHRLVRGDIISVSRTGPIRPVVVLAVEPRVDSAGREVVYITARDLGAGKDEHEIRPANASVLVRCDLCYGPATAHTPSPPPQPHTLAPRRHLHAVTDLRLPA